MTKPAPPLAAEFALQGKLWRPRRVFITPDAYALQHGRAMLERAASYGAEVTRLVNRLPPTPAGMEQQKYAFAKTTFAIVVSPPGSASCSRFRLRLTGRSTLRRVAHCQYCYLAGSLSGPPVTRDYANLPEILEGLRAYAGKGQVTSKSRNRTRVSQVMTGKCDSTLAMVRRVRA